jgi:hypothetical protein
MIYAFRTLDTEATEGTKGTKATEDTNLTENRMGKPFVAFVPSVSNA